MLLQQCPYPFPLLLMMLWLRGCDCGIISVETGSPGVPRVSRRRSIVEAETLLLLPLLLLLLLLQRCVALTSKLIEWFFSTRRTIGTKMSTHSQHVLVRTWYDVYTRCTPGILLLSTASSHRLAGDLHSLRSTIRIHLTYGLIFVLYVLESHCEPRRFWLIQKA